MRWLINFYDFRFKWTATARVWIHHTKTWLSQLVDFKMQSGREDTLEERYSIKSCFKLGKNATETYAMLRTAFGQSSMNRVSVFEWHKRFKEGRESVRDDERCGKSKEVRTPELIGQIKNFMDKDRRVSIYTISAQFDVSVGTVHTIIREELKMQKICGKFVPRVPIEDLKERRCHDSRKMVGLINSDPAVLDALVTYDEIWIYCYDSGRDSVRRGQRSPNRDSGISIGTMYQSTTPSLSQTIWLRWASRQFLTVPIVQTLRPVTFDYSLSSRKTSEAVVMKQLRRWTRL